MENIVIFEIGYLNSNHMTTGYLLFILSFICILKNANSKSGNGAISIYQIYTVYITKDPVDNGYI